MGFFSRKKEYICIVCKNPTSKNDELCKNCWNEVKKTVSSKIDTGELSQVSHPEINHLVRESIARKEKEGVII